MIISFQTFNCIDRDPGMGIEDLNPCTVGLMAMLLTALAQWCAITVHGQLDFM
jgi:hypothetical protein